MADQWNGQGGDHDQLIRLRQIIENLTAIISELKAEVSELKKANEKTDLERAKLVGWCAGASGVIGLVLRFWPK